MNRRLVVILTLLLALLLALGGFYLYLAGGDTSASEGDVSPTARGLIPVRSIYTANGENLRRPVGLGADANGDMVATLRDSQRVVMFDRQGDWIRTWGTRGLKPGNMMSPIGADYDRASGHVYVTDRSRLRLITYSGEGKYLWEVPMLNPLTPIAHDEGVMVTTFGPVVLMTEQGELKKEVGTRGTKQGQFDYARGGVVLDNNEAIIADTNNTRVQRIKLTGETTAGVVWVDGEVPEKQDDPSTKYGLPSSVAQDSKGRLYVLDGFRHAIVVLDPETGKQIHAYEELEGASDGRFNLPTAIAYLGGNLFAITDTYNDRVQILRIILPEEDNPVARYPWLLWLIPLLLLPLLFLFFGRKRWYVTAGTMELAESEGKLRLLAAVCRRIHVTADVYDRYKNAVESDVAIGEFLVPLNAESAEEPTTMHADETLVAQMPSGAQRLLLPRVRLVVENDERAEALSGKGHKTVTYADLTAEYALDGEKAPSSGETDDARG